MTHKYITEFNQPNLRSISKEQFFRIEQLVLDDIFSDITKDSLFESLIKFTKLHLADRIFLIQYYDGILSGGILTPAFKVDNELWSAFEQRFPDEVNNCQLKNNPKEVAALKVLFERYLTKTQENKEVFSAFPLPDKCSYDSLIRLLTEAYEHTDNYPTDKMHRWLGFSQGVLSVIGVIDVDEERDFTRPYLHSYHSQKPASF